MSIIILTFKLLQNGAFLYKLMETNFPGYCIDQFFLILLLQVQISFLVKSIGHGWVKLTQIKDGNYTVRWGTKNLPKPYYIIYARFRYVSLLR